MARALGLAPNSTEEVVMLLNVVLGVFLAVLLGVYLFRRNSRLKSDDV
jgi:hypothetical protein